MQRPIQSSTVPGSFLTSLAHFLCFFHCPYAFNSFLDTRSWKSQLGALHTQSLLMTLEDEQKIERFKRGSLRSRFRDHQLKPKWKEFKIFKVSVTGRQQGKFQRLRIRLFPRLKPCIKILLLLWFSFSNTEKTHSLYSCKRELLLYLLTFPAFTFIKTISFEWVYGWITHPLACLRIWI